MESPADAHRGGPASTTGSEYRDSMLRLLHYIGLEGYGTDTATLPPRTAEEQANIAAHMAEVAESNRRHAARNEARLFQNQRKAARSLGATVAVLGPDSPVTEAAPTVYLSPEESPEWRSFLRGVPPELRHTASARRRLTLLLWRAHVRRACLFCWMPQRSCICEGLAAFRAAMPSAVLARCAPVTMLLHPEELMRSTNSGHIAAFLLDAPLRVWGVPEDDRYLSTLPAAEMTGNGAGSGSVDDDCPGDGTHVETLHTALYPAEGAERIESFIHDRVVGSTQGAAAHGPRVHMILLDSTWPQAHSLNRHISPAVPRVALEVPPGYEARFARLRKRTRESGVSTLEATAMALEQCLTAMGDAEAAAQSTAQLSAAMETFVDVKCILKFTDAEFTTDAAQVRAITEARDAWRREEAHRRQAELDKRVTAGEEEVKALLPPPVCNYCYCCDRVIGWHRMAEHVLGRTHRAALLQNPTCEPSAASRERFVPDYSRPMRRSTAEGAPTPQAMGNM